MTATRFDAASRRRRFAELHDSGSFVMPNAWDVGSALIIESLGFEAVATTSSGLAASLGRHDQQVSLDELVRHVADLCSVLQIPVSVDSESGFSDDGADLAGTVERLAEAGASGVSIEDFLPGRGILTVDEASDRVAQFASAAAAVGITVTARAENHLYDAGELEDTIARLRSYRQAGAGVLYAPGLTDLADIARVVSEVEAPVNVLLLPGGPTVPEMTAVGVRRFSTGGSLAFAAYGALAAGARELLDTGTSEFARAALSRQDRNSAFGG
jgi:2-methylisocitrate lyase-like PEP mutase family enzyme